MNPETSTTAGGSGGSSPRASTVLAQARWPAGDDDELPAVAGFIESAFSPLIAAVAERCLSSYFGVPPAAPAQGERTAIVVASATGDLATAAAVAAAVQAGKRVPPLLFYQSNPNAVAGYIAARWGLSGPVVCTMPGRAVGGDGGDPREEASARASAEALATAGVLIDDGDADAALAIAANAYIGGPAYGTATLVGPTWWSTIATASATVATAQERGSHDS